MIAQATGLINEPHDLILRCYTPLLMLWYPPVFQILHRSVVQTEMAGRLAAVSLYPVTCHWN